METNIRKWGNSAGAIIPSGALVKAGFNVGDAVDVDVRDGEIIFKRTAPKFTLEELLKATPSSALTLTDEDREWLYSSPVGREVE